MKSEKLIRLKTAAIAFAKLVECPTAKLMFAHPVEMDFVEKTPRHVLASVLNVHLTPFFVQLAESASPVLLGAME